MVSPHSRDSRHADGFSVCKKVGFIIMEVVKRYNKCIWCNRMIQSESDRTSTILYGGSENLC